MAEPGAGGAGGGGSDGGGPGGPGEGWEWALGAVLGRVDAVEAAVGERFPLYAAAGGDWLTSRRGSWTGGFWVGCLWVRAAVTGSGRHRHAARRWTGRLAERAGDDTVTRAMTFWHGAAVGALLCGDDLAESVALAGARALVGAFDARYGAVPVGTAFTRDPRPRVGIDALGAVVALLGWAADRGMAGADGVGRAHAGTTVRLLLADDGRVGPEMALPRAAAGRTGGRESGGDPGGPAGVGHSPGADGRAGGWARGQAWGVLGTANAARRWPEFAGPARRAAAYWRRRTTPGVAPPAYLSAEPPGAGPVDTSAAVIAAAGLWTLADAAAGSPPVDVAPDGEEVHLARLVARHLRGGALLDGCYDADRGIATAHELIWGDHFLLALLARATGRVRVPLW
ncbi:glucuronyl hydrolase [Pilimelia anulata]|uniref:Glucuronyl hydrolase n=1 Tax=Pilimelia anulata TaxID=53371 RepID=A0A8J3FBE6_9ACTN|nr:hypothetical protein [Pilimelia anulata]GGJ83073.1 glucuronyl hydrolase [Pilimelia anulata]